MMAGSRFCKFTIGCFYQAKSAYIKNLILAWRPLTSLLQPHQQLWSCSHLLLLIKPTRCSSSEFTHSARSVGLKQFKETSSVQKLPDNVSEHPSDHITDTAVCCEANHPWITPHISCWHICSVAQILLNNLITYKSICSILWPTKIRDVLSARDVRTAAGETELRVQLLLGFSVSLTCRTEKLVLPNTLFQCSSVLPPSGRQGEVHTAAAFSFTHKSSRFLFNSHLFNHLWHAHSRNMPVFYTC